jgi:hypothetical protein
VYNVRGLPSVDSEEETTSATDLLEWLQTWFGFQVQQSEYHHSFL